jgi:hypothetical protein
MAASYFQQPALALEKSEAKAIAEALAEVSKHYSIPGLDPKHAAIMSLALVIAVTYGKRVPFILGGKAMPPTPASETGGNTGAVGSPAAGNTSGPATPGAGEFWSPPGPILN